MFENLTAKEILQLCKFDPLHDPGEEQFLLKIAGKLIGSVGNFITLTGLPKTGKGKIIAALIGSALSGKEIFGMRLTLPTDRQRIGFFSTDEGKYDLFNTCQIIKKLSGATFDKLDVCDLRKYNSSDIKTAVESYFDVYKNECSCIVIDTIGDLLLNYNGEVESKNVINDLKKWSDENNVLIIVVLHLGKGNNTSLGHLGSGVDRYAQSVLKLDFLEDEKIYRLTSSHLRRSAPIDPIYFNYNPSADIWQQVYHEEKPKDNVKPIIAKPLDYDIQHHKQVLYQIFNSNDTQNRATIIENIKIYYNQPERWATDCLKHLVKSNLIAQVDNNFSLVDQRKLFKAQ